MNDEKILAPIPCPFCGGAITVKYDETAGGYRLIHNDQANPECPIAHDKDEALGTFLYDTEEEAVEYCNKRTEFNAETFAGYDVEALILVAETLQEQRCTPEDVAKAFRTLKSAAALISTLWEQAKNAVEGGE